MYMGVLSSPMKKVFDPLELELQRINSCLVGDRNQTQVFYKSWIILNHGAIFSPTILNLFIFVINKFCENFIE